MRDQVKSCDQAPRERDGERGSALFLALMVALVMLFLGMGLALQTALGLKASGTDRWVVKSLYAADAGAMMQIALVRNANLQPPGGFTLADDTSLPGLLRGQYQVTVSDFCEAQPSTYVDIDGAVSQADFRMRFFHLRSQSTRTVNFVAGGIQTGLSRAAVEVDVMVYPFDVTNWVPVQECYE